MPDPSTPPLGTFRVVAKESQFSAQCDAVATESEARGTCYIVSVVGPATTIKAISAALNNSRSLTLSVSHCGEVAPYSNERYFGTDAGFGYDCKRVKLGFDLWHLLAISKAPHLIPVYSEAAVMRHLMSSRYTTPILSGWGKWLVHELKRRGHLRTLLCYNCKAAVLNLEQETLDDVVSQGVASGSLKIAKEAAVCQ